MTEYVPNPQRPGHMVEVCAECGWPPALDGRCLCFHPQHLARFRGRYFAYMTENLPRLRGLAGVPAPPEDN